MKIVMTLLVRNEAEILEANLDYHLAQGIDAVIVTDHGSTDETPEILRRYQRQGLVTVLRDDVEGHHQGTRVTRMARLAVTEHGADWVVHNDADEFWWPLAGDLRDVLCAVPSQYGHIVVRRNNFLPRPDGSGFLERLVYREEKSVNLVGGPLEPKVAHRAALDVVVAPGNHSLLHGGGERVPIGDLLEVFHFPQRNYEQFAAKVVQTGEGYELLKVRSNEVGRDQLELLEIFRRGELPGYYAQSLLSEDKLLAGQAAGEIVLDRRLADFMHRLPRTGAVTRRPDSSAAQSVVGQALQAATLAEQAQAAFEREKLALERAKTAAVQALEGSRAAHLRLTELEEDLSRLNAERESLLGELRRTGESLRLLRESRVIRWTRPARLLYHRLRRVQA